MVERRFVCPALLTAGRAVHFRILVLTEWACMARATVHGRVCADELAKRAGGLFDACREGVAWGVPRGTTPITTRHRVDAVLFFARVCTRGLVFVCSAALAGHRCVVVFVPFEAAGANKAGNPGVPASPSGAVAMRPAATFITVGIRISFALAASVATGARATTAARCVRRASGVRVRCHQNHNQGDNVLRCHFGLAKRAYKKWEGGCGVAGEGRGEGGGGVAARGMGGAGKEG